MSSSRAIRGTRPSSPARATAGRPIEAWCTSSILVAGLEITEKLRRGLGGGAVVPAAELAVRLARADGDGDGALSRAEFTAFLVAHGVGGPWFCEVLSGSFWRQNEQRLGRPSPTIEVARLAENLHLAMARRPRPERRYDISPEAIAGAQTAVAVAPELGAPGVAGGSVAGPRLARASGPVRERPSAPGRVAAAPAARPLARRPQARRPGPRR